MIKLSQEEVLLFIKSYQVYRDDHQLQFFFEKLKPYFELRKFNDPHKVLTPSDFENLAFQAFWKAVLKYDESKGDKPISWIYYIVRQTILREINSVKKNSQNCYNSAMGADFDIENFEDDVLYHETFHIDEKFINEIHKNIL